MDINGANSYTPNVQSAGTIKNVMGCEMACDSTVGIKGFSFYDGAGTPASTECTCWTDGDSGIATTRGTLGTIGLTYVPSANVESSSSMMSRRLQAEPTSKPSEIPSDHPSLNPSENPSE